MSARASRVLFLSDGQVVNDPQLEPRLTPEQRERTVADAMIQLEI